MASNMDSTPLHAYPGEQGHSFTESILEGSPTEAEPPLPVDPPGVRFSWRTFFAFAGPGWLMSLAYLDPGNLESDLQQGAYTNYSILWVLLLAHILGLILQTMAARLGAVTNKDLAETCRERYGPTTSRILFVMTYIAIIGADIQEVVGSGLAMKVLFGIPLWVGCLITGCDTFTFMLVHYFGSRFLELLIFVLVLVMCVCFVGNFAHSPPPAGDLLFGTFVPTIPDAYVISPMVATIGAVIMPHNLYLHSSLVKARVLDRSSSENLRQANKYFFADSTLALSFSFFINLCLVSVFAVGFFSKDCAKLDSGAGSTSYACLPLSEVPSGGGSGSCQYGPEQSTGQCYDVGLETAASALGGLFPSTQLPKILFALGVLAAGQASTMTGTFAGQYVFQGFVKLRLKIWQQTLLTRSVALVPAMIVAVIDASSPSVANSLGNWLNTLQSIQLPFALLPLLHFTSMPEVMGRFSNQWGYQVICWSVAVLLLGINGYLMVSFVQSLDAGVLGWIIFAILGIGYLALVVTIIKRDLYQFYCFITCKKRVLRDSELEKPTMQLATSS